MWEQALKRIEVIADDEAEIFEVRDPAEREVPNEYTHYWCRQFKE